MSEADMQHADTHRADTYRADAHQADVHQADTHQARATAEGTMADRPSVLHVTRDGAVATIRVDRPKANAVNPAMIEEFLTVLRPLAADPEVRCVVITGTGRFFIAGADIAVMRDLSAENQAKMRRWIDVQRVIEQAPKPVVAAMNGHALGGGAELSLACDLRIISSEATFGFPEMRLGLFPGAGGSQRLPRLVGPHVAKRLMIEGEGLTPQRAAELGLVDLVVEQAEFDAVVAERARRLAALPTAAIGLLKRVVDEGYGLPVEEALRREEKGVADLTGTADAAEGLQAFLDKRAPVFTGR
ncbi:enoyl-CoA hydratase/isomerase family protein [Streptomyces longisporoflavus]|uniref:Enoyl-CoA hydratase/isomerase family protein n=1 Tax=Streptomyces longisporoflavus TaxID=28044 RepID=A0ABW7QF60_9ACTN